MKVTKEEYKKALEIVEKYHSQDNHVFNEKFLEWRQKYFVLKIQIKEWQSKKQKEYFSTKELIKRFEKGMLESPFKEKCKCGSLDFKNKFGVKTCNECGENIYENKFE